MLAEDRVALVTGGSRGIGRAIAERLLAEGASVAITGRSAEKGEKAVAEMDGGDRIVFLPGDARSQRDVEGWVDATAERFGPADILINNAGGSSGFAYLEDLSDEAWQECADWTLNSGFWATRRVLKPMKERGWGRIVGISSVESKGHVTPTASHYTVFKAAMNALSRAVAIEYGPHGITSNVLCPGAVETDLMQVTGRSAAEGMGMTYEAFLDGYAQKTLTKKINTVDEVAAAAMLLISEAGSGITGTSINVDAGTSTY
jgi:3-hydroxybutyrate dehydrogenase